MTDEYVAMQSESSTECTICLLDYKEETKTETECNHIFHQECLDRWLQNNTSCPLCRTELYNSSRLGFRIEMTPLDELFIDRTIQPSGSIGITRVGSPFELNVTYADEVWISQQEEELTTQIAMDSLFSGGSAIHSSRMQNMGELFDFNTLYSNSMTQPALAGEEIISDRYRYPINEYFNNTIEEVD